MNNIEKIVLQQVQLNPERSQRVGLVVDGAANCQKR